MGHVIGKTAMQMAIDKAKKYGMGMVVVRNSTHFGIVGYYSIMAAKQDMIGFVTTNARPSIAPTFGVENMMGTNPLVFAVPTDEPFPFVTDYATSITQRGKIEVYEREGKAIPEGWVIDDKGNTRTDTAQVLKELEQGTCALLPIGGAGGETAGYKGYGFSVVAEVLSSALQAGSYLKMLSGFGPQGEKTPYHLGHCFMAQLTFPHLPNRKNSNKRRGILCGNCAPRRRRRVMTGSIPRGKKNIYIGLRIRIKAFL